MEQAFRCGHPRSPVNTLHEYGYTRCRTCKRRNNRRHMRRKRAEFLAEYGRYDAKPAA